MSMPVGRITFSPNLPSVSITPISDSRRIIRKRTIRIAHGRMDGEDVLAQISVILDELHKSKFTGELILNFGQGSIRHVQAIESAEINVK